MDDFAVPFIFLPRGDPEPTEWMARHPGAIKIPAVFVPWSGGQDGRHAELKVDLNTTLERMVRDVNLADAPAFAQATAHTTGRSAADPPSPEPQDPVAAYLRSQNAVGDYVATAARDSADDDAKTPANFDRLTFSDSVTAASLPRVVLVSDTTPAPPAPFDADADLKQGVTHNPDGTVKSMMVLVVTRPDGTQYIPKTRVKNTAQAHRLGLPIGTEIPIPVPKTQDPEGIVDDWRKGGMANPLLSFAWHWHPHGPNDYKRNTLPVPIFDAYGNFEYGATGAAKGFSLSFS